MMLPNQAPSSFLCKCEEEHRTVHNFPAFTQGRVTLVRQVRDTLGALAERFAALRPGGSPGLVLSRLARRGARPLALKRVVQYSPAWVKSQNRMASTSNQVLRCWLCTRRQREYETQKHSDLCVVMFINSTHG